MRLDERLTNHFQSTSQDLNGPAPELGTVMTASKGRSTMAKGAIGTGVVLLGLAILGLGLGFAPSRPLSNLWNSDNHDSDDTRIVVSPFIELEDRLGDPTEKELFRVTADMPAYWRIATLKTYEDGIWKTSGDFDDWRPPELEQGSTRTTITQEFEIKNLESIWLPAAPDPIEVLGSGELITSSGELDTLTVSNELETSDGLSYQVVSSLATPNPEQMRVALPPDLEVLGSEYVSTVHSPEGLNELAREITDGHNTDYDKALAIQDHLRTYTYSTDLGPRADDPVMQFLAERRGFSQQFAGTFALMARELGIPSRVAIGFTWGDPINGGLAEPDEEFPTYGVTGRHAHAWPEVYFEGIGWIAFEPTPGRGMPGAEIYTGVAAQQDSVLPPDSEAGN